MRILPGPDAVVPGEAQRAGHHAHDLVFALENGSLLDVRLEIGIERAPAHGSAARIPDAAERVPEANAVDVALLQQVLEREHARERAGAAHHRHEAASFLVGPYRDADRLV